jgi:5-formyltetrahydrofolate cyclo-ligase
MVRRLQQQKEEYRRRKSNAIRRKVFRLTAFRKARTVCCYVALPYEVQTRRMIDSMLMKGKRVVVPVAQPRTKRLRLSEVRDPAADLARGAHGVWEPRRTAMRPWPVRGVDMVLVPGVAFDRRGLRLGHGHGYFDRFLARVPASVPTIGLAYRFQVLRRLPTAAHDRAVQKVLSA